MVSIYILIILYCRNSVKRFEAQKVCEELLLTLSDLCMLCIL